MIANKILANAFHIEVGGVTCTYVPAVRWWQFWRWASVFSDDYVLSRSCELMLIHACLAGRGTVVIPITWLLADGDDPVLVHRLNFRSGVRYVVRQGDCCLSRDGEFDYEPMPSERTEEFLEHHRFASLEEAVEAYGSEETKRR